MKSRPGLEAKSGLSHGTVVRCIMWVYFGSGACSLMDQVVWVRLLKLTLGNTVYASSIVVSVFMGGLALGALLMSRWADRIKRPLKLYAAIELMITISALLLPWVLRLADKAYRWYYVEYAPSTAALILIQILVSSVILLVPTMLMGSTLPLLGRYVTNLQTRVGQLVGRLYALNTLGAALGCLLAGFVLIRSVGVMGTLYIAAVMNVFVAFGGWLLSKSPEEEVSSSKTVDEESSLPLVDISNARRRILILAFFISGLVCIGYEIIWMRSVSIPMGGFTYVFSAVLTVYLLGYVGGVWLGSVLSKRMKRPDMGFGVTLALLGVCGVFYMPYLSFWFLNVSPRIVSYLSGARQVPGVEMMLFPIIHTFCLYFLPSFIMGVGFPLGLQAWGNFHKKVGQTTGLVYGINTIGAVLGGLAAGFVLIPFLGVQLSIALLGLLAVWTGGAMACLAISKGRSLVRLAQLACAVSITVVAFMIPQDLFEKDIVGSPNTETLAVIEGPTTTAAVIRQPDKSLTLTSDGVHISGDDAHRIQNKMLGHLGVLLRENTTSALSVGFGAGETTACLAKHDLERIGCVEIAPELVDLALKFFKHINLGDRLNEEVDMTYMDAKNFLYLTDQKFDLIINGSDIPAYSGSAPLFAKEHFQNALEHLNENGLFITKLHIADITISNFDSIVGTFMEVFPHVTVWFPTTKPYIFFFLVGSQEEQVYSPMHIDNELGKPQVAESAALLNIHSSVDLFSCYIGDQEDIRRYLDEKGYHSNTDNRPYVEFNIDPKRTGMGVGGLFHAFVNTVRTDSIVKHIDFSGMPSDLREDWKAARLLQYEAATHLLQSHTEIDLIKKMTSIADGLAVVPKHPALLEKELDSSQALKWMFSNGRKKDVEYIIDKVIELRPDYATAWLNKSWLLETESKYEEALSAAKNALNIEPSSDAHRQIGVIYMRMRQPDKAIEHYQKALSLTPDDANLYIYLGMAFLRTGRLDKAIEQFDSAKRFRTLTDKEARVYQQMLAQQYRNFKMSQ